MGNAAADAAAKKMDRSRSLSFSSPRRVSVNPAKAVVKPAAAEIIPVIADTPLGVALSC